MSQQTCLSKDEVKGVLAKFMANNPDGQLDRNEFDRLYDELDQNHQSYWMRYLNTFLVNIILSSL